MTLTFVLALALFQTMMSQVRTYHPVTVTKLAAGLVKDTHVELTGCVALIKYEADGDTHIRVTEGAKFIVAECLPTLPCATPKLKDKVRVRGISRFDGHHRWYEVHPVEQLEVVGRCP